jgi:hypothetical protein
LCTYFIHKGQTQAGLEECNILLIGLELRDVTSSFIVLPGETIKLLSKCGTHILNIFFLTVCKICVYLMPSNVMNMHVDKVIH